MRSRVPRALACLALAVILASGSTTASQARLVSLEQMTQRAARIFSGRCISASVTFDPALGAEVAVATFRVDRAVKGVTGQTVTVRMLDAEPGFRRGEEVVLFLYGESAQGLSSPVGLGQGHFKVVTDKQGRRLALSAFGKMNLSANRPGAAPAPIDPKQLLDEVQGLVAARSGR